MVTERQHNNTNDWLDVAFRSPCEMLWVIIGMIDGHFENPLIIALTWNKQQCNCIIEFIITNDFITT